MRYRYIGKKQCNWRDERMIDPGDVVDVFDDDIAEQLDVRADFEALTNGDEPNGEEE